MSLPTQAVSSPVPFPFLLPRRVAPSSYIQYCSSNFGAWRFQASQQRGLDSAKEIQRLPPMNARSVFSPPKSRLGSGCPWLMATWLHVSWSRTPRWVCLRIRTWGDPAHSGTCWHHDQCLGGAGQWLGRAGNCGSPVANASLHQPLLNAGVWFGRLTWMHAVGRKKSASILRTWTEAKVKRLQPQCLDSNLQGAFSQYTCPFIVTHWVTISKKTHRSFFKATIVVWTWY